MCFILDKPPKKYFIIKDEECYRAGNAHSEHWRSSKLVCSTGNGHKAGQSLVFNLDLGWRCCKGCSLSPGWVGIAPALFLSEEWHSERFHRACSQEGKVLHRRFRASKDVRWAGCCAPIPSPLESEAGEQITGRGAQDLSQHLLCSSASHPGMAGKGPQFSQVQLRQLQVMLYHKGSPPQRNVNSKKKKIRVCNFLVHHPEKNFELGLCTWNLILL